MRLFIAANLRKERGMAWVLCNIAKHACLKANGKMIREVGVAWSATQMETDMKAISLKESHTEKVFILGLMARFTKVNGLKV